MKGSSLFCHHNAGDEWKKNCSEQGGEGGGKLVIRIIHHGTEERICTRSQCGTGCANHSTPSDPLIWYFLKILHFFVVKMVKFTLIFFRHRRGSDGVLIGNHHTCGYDLWAQTWSFSWKYYHVRVKMEGLKWVSGCAQKAGEGVRGVGRCTLWCTFMYTDWENVPHR